MLAHTRSCDQVIAELASNAQQGLSLAEWQARLAQGGTNEIITRPPRSQWQIFADQFSNIMLIMLMGVAVLSAVMDWLSPQAGEMPFKDAIAIFSIVLLNGILGYLQESKAATALLALQKMAVGKVKVLRQGQLQEVDSRDLVVGDIYYLSAGDQVSADGRLLMAENLQVQEAALTGESHAVLKRADVVLPEDTPLGDRLNMVYKGTAVSQGRGIAIVTAVGMQTELGKIAEAITEIAEPDTPLQRRMEQLSYVLVSGALCLVALVVVLGLLWQGWEQWDKLLEVSLSMAVAVVPEGLPAVITVTLAIGTQRMVRRNALIRKLPAVETLGSVTTICTDKTGTLTQNKMVVQAIATADQDIAITEEMPAISLDQPEDSVLGSLLLCGLLCNDAHLQQQHGSWQVVGDPTEGALLMAGARFGLEQAVWQNQLPRMAELPFDSDRKRMSVMVRQGQRYRLYCKGSPESVLQCCDRYLTHQQIAPLTETIRQEIVQKNDQFALQGLRVLGFAQSDLCNHIPAREEQLVWLGLMGLQDPPRPEVKAAIAKCYQAGMRVIMITGDHQLTATAIAKNLGIISDTAQVLTGQDLDQLSPSELCHRVAEVNVYARVAPHHKLQIVQALQSLGHYVAMTGDGVNDAPALKQADIGIAMGITGTEVSKSASDMVLLDDNFATIVSATEEGRVVYSNIRKFIKYILGSNIGEVLTVASAPLLGLGAVPLTPLQILWMNLVTDGLPALALALEPAEPDVMQVPPFDPKESIFARGLGLYMVRVGIILAIFATACMVWAYSEAQVVPLATDGDRNRWQTMVFTTLCLSQMGHALALRSQCKLTIELNPLGNIWLLIAIGLTTILQILLIYVEPLRNFFKTDLLTPTELLVCFGFSTLVFVWVEMEKLFLRIWLKKNFGKNHGR